MRKLSNQQLSDRTISYCCQALGAVPQFVKKPNQQTNKQKKQNDLTDTRDVET